MPVTPSLAAVLEMSLSELAEAVLHLARDADEGIYAHGLRLFLTNQLEALGEHVAVASACASPAIVDLLRLRLALRQGAASDALRKRVEALAAEGGLLAGEAAFVLAMSAEQSGDEPRAKAWWQRAYETLGRAGCRKKAAKAFHNVIATESRIHPEKRLIAEYREAILLCERAGELVALANAHLNLSREFQLLGALNLALRHAEDAVETTRREQLGGLQYYLSIAQRCHVLIELGLQKAAVVDFEELQCAAFPEARAAAEVIAPLLGTAPALPSLVAGQAAPTASWQERRQKLAAGAAAGATLRFTNLENRAIEILALGPRDRFALAEELFGEGGDLLAKENRLKQLLHRLRKKAPGLIGLHDHRYFLAEASPANARWAR